MNCKTEEMGYTLPTNKIPKKNFEFDAFSEFSSSPSACSMKPLTGVPKDSCSSSESLGNFIDTKVSRRRSFRASIKSCFGSTRGKSRTSIDVNYFNAEDYELSIEESQYSADSLETQEILRERRNDLRRICSSTSSIKSNRFKFWSNSTEDEIRPPREERKPQSSRSALSDTIVYHCPPRHKIRFWLNERRNGYSDSILEIRQSAITTRITRSRCLAGIAAVEAAKIGEYRRKVRAWKFAGAATAAAFARVKKAKNDINASHGSIANAAMHSFKAIAAASIVHPEANRDYKKILSLFDQHFKHKNEHTYFRRLKYIPMRDLERDSAAYKMHMRLKAIPTPSCQDNTYIFFSTRLDRNALHKTTSSFQHILS